MKCESRKKGPVAEIAERYGVGHWVIRHIGFERFCAMAEDARRTILADAARSAARKSDGIRTAAHPYSLKGIWKMRGAARLAKNAATQSYSTADWMERFARDEEFLAGIREDLKSWAMWRQRMDRLAARRNKPAELPPHYRLEYVEQLVALAGKAGVA